MHTCMVGNIHWIHKLVLNLVTQEGQCLVVSLLSQMAVLFAGKFTCIKLHKKGFINEMKLPFKRICDLPDGYMYKGERYPTTTPL